MRKSLIIIMLFLVAVFVLNGGSPLALLLPCLLGMAKVTGPLFSVSASGKLADAMVHFPWKGRAVVRKWLKPSNPQTGGQGDVRVILGGIGRACSVVHTASQYAVYAREVADPGQTWVSSFVAYIRNVLMPTVAAYTDESSEETNHSAHSDFIAQAVVVGLTAFDLDYKAMPNGFSHALQLYELAKFGCNQYIADNTKFLTAPYTKALATWVLEDIELMVADFASL